jgi:hypothetical protein
MDGLSDFQRQFLARSDQVTMFTQKEFDDALNFSKAEIMTIAIEATKQAVLLEREACAKMADECVSIEELGDAIRNRRTGKGV